MFYDTVILYLILINIVAVIMTVVDKVNAMNGRWRISENMLLTVGLLGGAVGELVTMKIIHHKTRHKKFMIGLPAEIAVHVVVLALLFLY